jgi:PAS domain S-box-containing protein
MDLSNLHQLTRNFIVVINNKGIINDLTPMQSKPLDYHSSELLGTKFTSFIHKNSITEFTEKYNQQKINSVEKVDFKLITKKNQLEWYRLSIHKTQNCTTIYCNEIHEFKLNESIETFKYLADAAPMPIVGFNYPNLSLNYSNKSFNRVMGFDYSEIKNFKSWHKRIVFKNKDDMKIKGKERTLYIEKMIQGAFEEGEPLRRTLITKNGIKKFEISFTALNKNFIYAFFHDITEQSLSRSILIESENKIRTLLENLPISVLSFDLSNNNIFANKKQKQFISHILPKIKKIEDLVKFISPTNTKPKAVELLKNTIKSLRNFNKDKTIQLPDNEFKLKCADGVERIFKVKSSIINNVFILIFKDITDERNALHLLENSEKNFKALAKNMPTAIGAYDVNEKIIFLNKHFTKLTGYTIKDIPTLKEWYKKSQTDVKLRKELYNYWTNLLSQHKNGTLKNKPTLIRKIRCKNGTTKYINFLFSISDETYYVQALDVTEETLSKKELEKSHEQLRMLTGTLQNEIEKERKYISREIHDELGQQITSIKMQIGNIWKKIKSNELENEYRSILSSIDYSIQTVRNISTRLRPSILDDFGLQAALEWQVKEFTKTSIANFTFVYKINESELSKETQLHFFRIVQESLTNIKRHANASKVSLILNDSKDKTCLTVKDNGKGFNTNKSTNTMGITLMKERIIAINGTFNIKSILNKGTTIKICIPRLKKKK